MDPQKYLIFINGTDKTEAIRSCTHSGDKCMIVFQQSAKTYSYNENHVEAYRLQREIPPDSVQIIADGKALSAVRQILDFGAYYKIRTAYATDLYPAQSIQFRENLLAQPECRSLLDYYHHIAEATSLVTQEGYNILAQQYKKIGFIDRSTALGSYLAAPHKVAALRPPDYLIYPFGLNQSQKQATEQAFSSQISIIQGPPGTGKTQTILNIIANAVIHGQTVAVVSNNNAATHNVAEKLQKKNLGFLTAFLGSRQNKADFIQQQTGLYPDMHDWRIPTPELHQTESRIRILTDELSHRLSDRNRMAEVEQELAALEPEEHYFTQYYDSLHTAPLHTDLQCNSQKTLSLWTELEALAEHGKKPGLFAKLKLLLRYRRQGLRLSALPAEQSIPLLQKHFYATKEKELQSEHRQLSGALEHYAFSDRLNELTDLSMKLFKHKLAERYQGGVRPVFSEDVFYRKPDGLNQEYPVILSTTYSIKSTLSGHLYDYLIVDESSQVDLVTGVLALSCAKNVIIVGDLKQLPNVLTKEDMQKADRFRYAQLDEAHCFTRNSLLSSAVAVWPDAPSVLLREHYRCHPKIINFCNQKYYHGQLITMTEDHGEKDALCLFHTADGNHARGHTNQREIDVIEQEVLPRLHEDGYTDIGVISPYRKQVEALQHQLPEPLEIDTVHKFQGREKEAIVLTSVDNVISDFVDDPHMLNVAVSRAVDSLTVVTSGNPQNDHSSYGELARYIAYHNLEVIESQTYSVFDLLYKGHEQQRQAFLRQHQHVSDYDSENLLHSVIEDLLREDAFSHLDCAVHVALANVIRSYEALSEEERLYARNPLTHLDFLLFSKMDKQPVLAIEVDGTSFHAQGSRQAERDALKDHILRTVNLPLLRLRTDGSGEKEKITAMLQRVQES